MTRRTYAATPAQQAMIMQNLLRPADGSSNLSAAYHLAGDVDVARLEAVLRLVADAAPGLATMFVPDDGLWAAVPAGAPPVTVRALTGHASADEERFAVAQEVAVRADLPIAPDAWTQCELEILTGRFGTYLTLVASHLVVDVYSFYAFTHAVSALYPGLQELEDASAAARALGIGEHPGSVAGPEQASSPQPLAEWLGSVTSLAHDRLPGRRVRGVLPGAVQRAPMPAALAARFRQSDLVARHGSTAVLLAAHAFLLSTTAGTDQVVIGVPLANRHSATARRAVGYFVNTLPLVVDCGGATSWDELCGTVASRLRTLVRHQDVDLATQLPRIAPHLHRGDQGFDNAFTVYRRGLTLQIEGVEVSPIDVPRRFVAYPLATTVADLGDGYLVEVSACDRVLPSRPLERYLHIVERLLDAPDASPASTPLLSADLAAAVDLLVNREVTYPEPVRLDTVLAQVAASSPDAVALVHGGGTTTYRELAARVDAWAAHLQEQVRGPRVLVALPRGPEQVVAVLAVLRSGKAYVPIDRNAPPGRLAYILAVLADADAEPAPVICDVDQPTFATGAGTRRLLTPAALDAPPPSRDLRASEDVDAAAYVIFTSGSTGEPKGVEVTHRNVGRLLTAAADHLDLTADDRWCLFHSVAFDFSVWELFGSLLSGGSLVVLTDEDVRDPVRFAGVLVATGVTVLNQTPSAFRRLVGALDAETARRLAVRWTVFGGEALYPQDLGSWFDLVGPHSRVLNMYGITETTVHTTALELMPEDVHGHLAATSPIGRPLGDLRVTVVDPRLRQVPVGVPGEILVSGPGISNGYLARPALTADRFLTGTPFGPVVYRSGDAATVQADGSLSYLGRLDRQVQLRGYRIELAEVEAALRTLPGVSDAVVHLREDGRHEPHLAAWVAVAPGRAAPRRADLVPLLPEYMIPVRLTALPGLPVTVNGKIDIEALLAAPPRGPATPTEENDPVVGRILSVFMEVVGVEGARPEDRFLDVGATSMHLVELHRRLRDEVGLRDLTLVDLFDGGCARDLAARAGAPEDETSLVAASGGRPVVRRSPQVVAARRTIPTTRGPIQAVRAPVTTPSQIGPRT